MSIILKKKVKKCIVHMLVKKRRQIYAPKRVRRVRQPDPGKACSNPGDIRGTQDCMISMIFINLSI